MAQMEGGAQVIARIPLNSLVDSALTGNGGAWRQLVGRLSPWALRFARRRLPRGLEPEDAVQEAFLPAYQKLPDLRAPEALPAWFAAILGSHCLRLIMDRAPESSLEQLAESGLLPPALDQGPEDALCSLQFLAAFDAALEALPMHLRDVCRLHYRRGLSVPEVALACAMPEGTVKKRLFMARPRLQEHLARFRSEGLFRVGFMPVSDHLLAMCADRLNQGRNLPLLSRRYLSWGALAADLTRGRLDAAFIMAPLALSLRQAGTPLLYVMDGHHDGSALFVSHSAQRPRMLGVPGERSTHRVLLHLLKEELPDLANLPTQVVNPSCVPLQLRQNSIGGFFCAEPWSAKCASQGLGQLRLRSRDILPGHLCCILAVRREFAESRSEVVTGYLRLLLASRDRVRRDLEFAAHVLAAGTGSEPGLARLVLVDSVSFDDLAPDLSRMTSFLHLAQEAGVLSGPCTLAGFACPELLAASA